MRMKVMLVFVLAAILTIIARGAEYWTNYPSATYPGIVTDDWTFLIGSKSHGTNQQVNMPMLMQITKTNAQNGMQPLSANLTLWASHTPSEYQTALGYTAQQQSANLDAWSLLATSAKQNHSSGLDFWSVETIDGITIVNNGGVLSAVTGGSGTLTGPGSVTAGHIATWNTLTSLVDSGHALSEYLLLSQIASGSQNGVLSSSDWTTFNGKQAGSANLTSWSGFTPTGYTNGLYGLWQPLLGFTPLTFQQTSNLILTLTIPLDALATNGQVSLFGIDSFTNPVPVHLANNLSLTPNGVGGYDLSSTGGSGSATPIAFTNLYGRDTNALIIDPMKSQTFSLGMLTNNILVISNTVKTTNLFTHDLEVNLHQWTNGGARLLAIRNLTGNLTTNGTWTQTTNGNVTDKLIIRFADGTYTNLVLSVITNCSSYVDTNSLLAAGGGGGGSFPTGADVDWRFNGSLVDSSGNGNTALLTNGVANYTADENSVANGALLFGTNNGNAGWVQTASSSIANYTGDLTASMWVRFDSDFSPAPILFSKGTFDGGGYYFQVHYANVGDFHAGHGILNINQASAGGASQSVQTGDREIAPDHVWMNLIVERSGTTITIYLNGTALTMSGNPTSLTMETTSFLLRVGNYSFADDNPSTTSPFIGAMSQFTIWPRALNSTERGQIVSGGSL